MFDTIIRGGTVIDGTGLPGFSADVGITAGKIAAVGALSAAPASRVIDASGRVVTPGFIDIHRHADAAAFRPGYGELELRQGLTTIVNGNCGLSAAPFGETHAAAIRAYLRPITGDIPAALPSASMADYLAALHDLPLHTGMLAGAGILRADAAGYELERLEDAHYRAIHRAMERALADGALGVSLGLGYAPECFYTTAELIRALEPLRGQDIPLTVHMRQEGAGVCEAVEEMLTVARALRIPLHISHLKAMGRDSWGKKVPRALDMLTRARQEGMDVSCDVYPYTAGSTQLLHILPPEFLEGGMDAVVKRLRDPAARRELELPAEGRHILLMSGSIGCGPMTELARQLDERLRSGDYATVLCGSNRQMLYALQLRSLLRVQAVGFTSRVAQYMDSADLLVSKPGGISITEAACKGVPMLLADLVGGCETRNQAFFADHGWAEPCDTDAIADSALSLLADDARRQALVEAQRRDFDGQAAARIADAVLCRCGRAPAAV